MSRRNWSRQETLMALAFYLCPPLPRKNWDDSDAEIQLLAGEIGRTESAVCFKIASLKACDPNRTGLGFTNTAEMDRQVISEHLANPDATISEAMWELEQIGIQISYNGEIKASGSSRPSQPQQLGLERVEQVRTRVNQEYFRSVLLSNYGGICCLTASTFPPCSRRAYQAVGGGHAERAPHVIEQPFAQRAARPSLRPRPHHARRPLPRRGLLARAAHAHNDQWLYAFGGRKIALPGRDKSTWPSLNFIHYHNDCVFERCA